MLDMSKVLVADGPDSKHEIRDSKKSQMPHFKKFETQKDAISLNFRNSDLFKSFFNFGYAETGSEPDRASASAESPSCNSRR